MLHIAMLHLAPFSGALTLNQDAVERGIRLAADAGAHWVITSELATSGYSFATSIGTDWITPQPDAWAQRMAAIAARYRMALFLGLPEWDPLTGALYDTVLAIAPDGSVAGRHRKVNTLRVGAEAWSSPGKSAGVVDLGRTGKAGILVCADACTPAIAEQMRAEGAHVLVSAAAWAPGLYGPEGEWEALTERTGLPLFVCNRTGSDPALDFTAAESIVADRGRRLLSRSFAEPTLLLVEWDSSERRIVTVHDSRIGG